MWTMAEITKNYKATPAKIRRLLRAGEARSDGEKRWKRYDVGDVKKILSRAGVVEKARRPSRKNGRPYFENLQRADHGAVIPNHATSPREASDDTISLRERLANAEASIGDLSSKVDELEGLLADVKRDERLDELEAQIRVLAKVVGV